MKKQICRIFHLREEELSRVAIMLVSNFLGGVVYEVLTTLADTLFISRFKGTLFGLQGINALPAVYLLSAICVTIIGSARVYFERFLAINRVITWSIVFLAGLMSLSYFGLGIYGTVMVLYPALLIACDVVYLFIGINRDIVQNQMFDVRQAKRVFNIIVGGYIAGQACGALSVTFLVKYMEVVHLFVLVLACLLAGLWIFLTIYKNNKSRFEIQTQAETTESTSSSRLFRMKFVWVLGGVVIAINLFSYFIDYQFKLAIGMKYSEKELASFLGTLYCALDVLEFFILLFAVNRFIARFGLFATFFMTPVVFLLISLFSLAAPFSLFLLLAIFIKVVHVVDSETFGDVRTTLLFQSFSADLRAKAQSFIFGIIYPFSAGLCALLLMFFAKYSGGGFRLLTIMAWSLVVFSALFIAYVLLVRKEYLANFVMTVKQKSFDFSMVDNLSPSIVESLRSRMLSPDPEEVVYAMEIGRKTPTETFLKDVEGLVSSPNKIIRVKALNTLVDLNHREAVGPIERIFDEALARGKSYDEDTFIASVRGMCAFKNEDAVEKVAPILQSSDGLVRVATAAALLKWCGLEGMIVAAPHLKEMLSSTDARLRCAAGEIILSAELTTLKQSIARLLSDTDPAVRRQAVDIIGALKISPLYENLMTALDERELRRTVMTRLVEIGNEIVPDCRKFLFEEAASSHLKQSLVRVLGKIRSKESLELLVECCGTTDLRQRTTVLRELFFARANFRNIDKRGPLKLFNDEIVTYTHLIWMVETVAAHGEKLTLFTRSLLQEAEDASLRILFILGFLCDRTLVESAYYHLEAGGEEKGVALELLDNILKKPYRDACMVIFDDLPRLVKLDALKQVPVTSTTDIGDCIRDILSDRSYAYPQWVKVCALYCTGVLKEEGCSDLLDQYARSGDAIYRDTALLAMAAIDPQMAFTRAENQSGNSKGTSDHLMQMLNAGGTMLSTIDKLFFLKKVEIFAQLKDEYLAGIAQSLREKGFQEGDVVFKQGDIGRSMYIITSGKVEINAAGKVLAILEKGDFFGEMSVLDLEPRSATAVAAEPTVLLSIDQHELFELMREEVEIAYGIIRMITKRLREMIKEK